MTRVYYRTENTAQCECDPGCKERRINEIYGHVLREGYGLQEHVPFHDTARKVQKYLDQGHDVIVGLIPILCESIGPVKMRALFVRKGSSEEPEQ